MPLNNSVSNIIGTKIPFWLWQQLQTRSKKGVSDYRDNEVLKYITNKTAWIRLVSSIDIKDSDLEYFRKMNPDIAYGDDLAKQYALFGGTSKYLSNNSYAMRSGFSGMDSNPLYGSAYGIIGRPNEYNNEVANYGYRPMPGISSVNIETQGRLGSVRSATINFKCWDKDQLDIIDALYFKLGFTMFLEWGHTFYFPSQNPTGTVQTFDPNKAVSTELMSIDPFNPKYRKNKEAIFRTIATNYAKSEGNYDAMLGIVTNFNFSFNQEGGYDCVLKIISLGVLGDSIKINHSSKMVEILQEQVKSYEDTLKQIELSFDKRPGVVVYTPPSISATREALKNPSNTKIYSGVNKNENVLVNIGQAGEFLYIKSLDKFLPLNLENFANGVNVTLNTSYFQSQINKNRINFFASDEESPWVTHGSLKNGFYQDNLSTYQNWDGKNFEEVNKIYKGPYRSIDRPDKTGFGVLRYRQKYTQEDYIFEMSFERPFKIDNDTEENYLDLAVGTEEYNLIKNLISNKNSTYKTTQEIGVESVGGFLGIGSTTSQYSLKIKDFRIDSGGTASPVYGTKTAIKINTAIINALRNSNNRYRIQKIEETELRLLDSVDRKLGYNFFIKVPIRVKLDSTITVKGLLQQINGKYEVVDESVTVDVEKDYEINAIFSFSEVDLIRDFTVNNPTQTQTELISQISKKQEDTSTEQKANQEQQYNPFSHLSSLELSLRSVQVHSLVQAIKQTQDVNIKSNIVPIELWKSYGSDKTFVQQIFTNGIFTRYVDLLTSGPNEEGESGIDDTNYDLETNEEEKAKVYVKYGFFTKLLANEQPLYALGKNGKPLSGVVTFRNFKPVKYTELFTSYVLPYNINQTIESGTALNHPVYIQFGLFLMMLNHSCTIYDTEGKTQRPLVYIDYNPNHNFCLTVPHQLSTDPFRVMIPFEGTDSDYRQLFDENILQGNQIKAVSGSAPTDLFVPRQLGNKSNPNRDNLSGTIKIAFKDEGSNYRGKTMNILLNIDYLMDTIKQYAKRDEENKVFLKPLIEQILSDINKCTGNFNIFRLAYNDAGNVFYIIDDQLVEPDESKDEGATLPSGEDNTQLPIFGKGSIAKSLEIRTDVSTRLSNMLAISANSKIERQGTLSTDATPFGFINYNYTDRYIPERSEITGSEISLQGEIAAATDFNSAIKAFYGSSNLDEQKVSSATNYYIDKLTKIKASGSATRAAAMIPVSLNFTTDGISGLSMGQAFTVDKNFLPYTYSIKKMFNDRPSDNKVGFVIIGLNHTIEANSWNTSVKTNMIFLKDRQDYDKPSEIPVRLQDNLEPVIPQETAPLPTNSNTNLELIKQALIRLGITKKEIIIAAQANSLKESGARPIAENLNYSRTSNSRIREIFGDRVVKYTDAELDQLKRNPENFAELVYGPNTKIGRGLGNTELGDAYKYRGRGFIQLTGKKNYEIYSKKQFGDSRLVKNPDLILDVKILADTSALYIKDGLSGSIPRSLGLNIDTVTQRQADLLITSIIAGRIIPSQGYLADLLKIVNVNSKKLEQQYA